MSKLQEVRLSRGWSQSELAKESGVNVRMIQDYEQGKKNINHAWVDTALKLADALKVDIKEILN